LNVSPPSAVAWWSFQPRGLDPTGTAGKLAATIVSAVATMERDLLIARTHAGRARARAEGRIAGRPEALDAERKALAKAMLASGLSLEATAESLGVARGGAHGGAEMALSSDTLLWIADGAPKAWRAGDPGYRPPALFRLPGDQRPNEPRATTTTVATTGIATATTKMSA
jgi:hypothetical protein